MTEEERRRELRVLQRKMQQLWYVIEFKEKRDKDTELLWFKYEQLEAREKQLLRTGQLSERV